GASLTAYLDRNLAAKLAKPAHVRLLRPVAAVPSETSARLSVPVAEADFDRRGFVQLAPLPAGSFLLGVRRTDGAYGRARPRGHRRSVARAVRPAGQRCGPQSALAIGRPGRRG